MKLSIIVAVYNTSKYLHQCLDSVLNQDIPTEDYEVIIVNDCSTDDSKTIIEEMIADKTNVIFVDKQINEATFWSRVDGMRVVTGDYIGFVDSDDWCETSMYRIMYEKACKYKADILECGIINEYNDGSNDIYKQHEDHAIDAIEEIRYYSSCIMNYALFSRIYSRSVIDAFLHEMLPYFEQNHNEYRGIRNEDDLLFPLLLSRAQKYAFICDNLSHHRTEVEGSTMDLLSKDTKKIIDSCVYRVKAGFDVMRFTKDKPDVFELIQHKQIDTIFGLLGKCLDYDDYTSQEKKVMVTDAIRRFDKEKSGLKGKDFFRYIHLKCKASWCFKSII